MFDALRTKNLPALDNAEQYAELIRGGGDTTPQRARAVAAAGRTAPTPAAAPPPLLQAGERVEVLWGDRYFAGTFTSSRARAAEGIRLHRIWYDAVGGWHARGCW